MTANQSTHPLSILHLEDDASFARKVNQKLIDDGFNISVELVRTYKDFLENLKQHSYQIIFLDDRVSDGTGLQALEVIKQQQLPVSVVMFSEFLDEVAIVDYMRHGAVDYVLKSNLERLPEVVRNIINENQKKNATIDFPKFFETSTDLMCSCDKQGRLIEINQAWKTVLGFPIEELKGKSLLELIYPDDRQTALTQYQALFDSNKSSAEFTACFVAQNGDMRWLQWHTALQTGEVLYVIARDITELKQNEIKLNRENESLSQQVEQYKAEVTQKSIVADQIHDSVITTDLKGIITSWNHGSERVFGYSAGETVGQHIALIYPEKDYKIIQNQAANILLEQGSQDFEIQMQRKSGEVFDARLSLGVTRDHSGEVNGMIGYAVDMGPVNVPEQDATPAKQRLETVIETSPVVTFACECQGSHKLRYISPNIEVLFGFSDDRCMTDEKFLLDHCHADDREQLQKALDSLPETESFSHAYRMRKADGEHCWVHSELKLLKDSGGKAEEIAGMLIDVEQLHYVQQQMQDFQQILREKEQQLNEAQQHTQQQEQQLGQLHQAQQQKQDYQQLLQEKEQQLGEAQQQAQRWENQLKEVQQQAQQLEQQLLNAEQQLNNVQQGQQERQDHQQLLQEKEQQLGEAQQQAQQWENQLKEVQQQAQQLQQQLLNAEQQLNSVQQGQQERQDHQQLLQEKEQQLGEAQRQAQQWEHQLKEVQEQAQQREQQLQNSEQQLNQLETELQTALHSLEQLQNQQQSQKDASADTELHTMAERAEKAVHMNAEFLSGISHELRVTLNAILGFAQIMALDETLSENNTQYLNEITDAGNRLLDIVNRVLDVVNLETTAANLMEESFQIFQLIEECQQHLMPDVSHKGVELVGSQKNIDQDHEIHGDRQRLQQVLMYVLGSAIKNAPGGSKVSIDLERQQGNVRIAIKNDPASGKGEAHTALPQSEDLPRSEVRSANNARLELLITQSLLELMGGNLRYEFNPDKVIAVTIPESKTAAGDAIHLMAAEDSDEYVSGEEKIILYVEDDAASIRLVETLLKQRPDCKVVATHELAHCVELVKSNQPSLLLLNINLAEIDAHQLLEQWQQESAMQDIPVAIVTTDNFPGDLEKLQQLGVAEVLTKPIEINRFLSMVDAIINVQPTEELKQIHSN